MLIVCTATSASASASAGEIGGCGGGEAESLAAIHVRGDACHLVLLVHGVEGALLHLGDVGHEWRRVGVGRLVLAHAHQLAELFGRLLVLAFDHRSAHQVRLRL